MRLIFTLSLMFLLFSCGKTDKKTKQESLHLSGLQNSGLNLGAGSDYYGRFLFVSCDNNGVSTNYQRITELQTFRNSIHKGFVNFTIVGNTASPAQMISLIDIATNRLMSFQLTPYCPSKTLAEIAI